MLPYFKNASKRGKSNRKFDPNRPRIMERSAGWITGKLYYDPKCDCDIPPWEDCPHAKLGGAK